MEGGEATPGNPYRRALAAVRDHRVGWNQTTSARARAIARARPGRRPGLRLHVASNVDTTGIVQAYAGQSTKNVHTTYWKSVSAIVGRRPARTAAH